VVGMLLRKKQWLREHNTTTAARLDLNHLDSLYPADLPNFIWTSMSMQSILNKKSILYNHVENSK